MATKSILRNVTIRDNHSAQRLVNALEFAQSKKCKEVNVPEADVASVDDVKKMFAIQ